MLSLKRRKERVKKRPVSDRPIIVIQDGLRFDYKTDELKMTTKEEIMKLWGFKEKDEERYLFISADINECVPDSYYVIGLLLEDNYREMSKRLKAEIKKDLKMRNYR